MTLRATYTEDGVGIWSITCEACPLAHHAVALGQEAPKCLSGIATKMQGPIVLNKCKHTSANKVSNAGDGSLALECGAAA